MTRVIHICPRTQPICHDSVCSDGCLGILPDNHGPAATDRNAERRQVNCAKMRCQRRFLIADWLRIFIVDSIYAEV